MADERLQHTAVALSYVLVGFLVLTGMGLVHHAYWIGAGVAAAVALLALPPISRQLLAAVTGSTAVSTTIYALVLLAGVTTMFVFVEAERDRRHEEYWSQREAIVERARSALDEERYGMVRDLAARYRHVGDKQLAKLAEHAREAGQRQAGTYEEKPGERSTQEKLREKLERQNTGLEELE
jgi:uncharacterized membrane protein YuzA (DUF378 family)